MGPPLTVAMQDVSKVQVQHGLGNVHACVQDGTVVELRGLPIAAIHGRCCPANRGRWGYDKCLPTERIAEAALVAVLQDKTDLQRSGQNLIIKEGGSS